MKLIINNNQITEHPEQFLRRAGYVFIHDRRTGKDSFVRRLTRDYYPRLHLYLKKNNNKIIFDLHIDQKKVSYAGAHMHSAEYDGDIVEGEIARLKSFFSDDKISNEKEKVVEQKQKNNFKDVQSAKKSIGSGTYEKNLPITKKKSWWRRLF